MKRRLILLWSWAVRVGTGWWPDFSFTMRVRGWLYGRAMRRCGKDFQVGSDVRLLGLQCMEMGDHVYIAPGCVILAAQRVVLSSEVMLAFHCVITDGDHTQTLGGSYRFGERHNASVFVGEGTWIAAHCTLVSNVTIGRGVLVAAGSVVTRNLPDGCIAGGVPAQILREETPKGDRYVDQTLA